MKINKYLATVVFHFDGMLHASQYDTRKMTIFCACKSLFQFTTTKMIIFCAHKNWLNNKKSLKGYYNCCVKRLQKNLGGRKPSLNLTLKRKWYHSCGCSDDSQSCEQLKKRVTAKSFEKKLDFEPKSSSVTGKVCYHYNSWVTAVYKTYILDRNLQENHLRLSDHLNQI